jgi:uncharacterized damage-inducible protein DinB
MKPHFLMMARYNAWANLRLYKMAGALPEELYRREVGVYFKSLHETLNHLLVTDRIWMRRLTGKGSHPDKLNAIAFDDFASLQAARTSEDLRIVNYIEHLQEADIEKELDYTTLNGTPQRQPICEILAQHVHLITLSARASTFCGITNPNCFAVFRLITSSNFVGCSTGSSAGLAPFKILST